MKEQTFIAKIYDAAGTCIDFERFTCKRAETVKKHMLRLFDNELYRICTRGAEKVVIYATPAGMEYNVMEFNV